MWQQSRQLSKHRAHSAHLGGDGEGEAGGGGEGGGGDGGGGLQTHGRGGGEKISQGKPLIKTRAHVCHRCTHPGGAPWRLAARSGGPHAARTWGLAAREELAEGGRGGCTNSMRGHAGVRACV